MKPAATILANAELLYSLTEIEQALDRLAQQLNQQFAELNPIVLAVMNGAIVATGQLLPKLNFPLQLDYIHISRYGDDLVGSELNWLQQPNLDLAERNVIIIEDIFDVGITMQALREYCQQAGVLSVSCLALINKLHDNKVAINPEFIGLTTANRYLFGFGMDYQGYWRNASGIFAIKDE